MFAKDDHSFFSLLLRFEPPAGLLAFVVVGPGRGNADKDDPDDTIDDAADKDDPDDIIDDAEDGGNENVFLCRSPRIIYECSAGPSSADLMPGLKHFENSRIILYSDLG